MVRTKKIYYKIGFLDFKSQILPLWEDHHQGQKKRKAKIAQTLEIFFAKNVLFSKRNSISATSFYFQPKNVISW